VSINAKFGLPMTVGYSVSGRGTMYSRRRRFGFVANCARDKRPPPALTNQDDMRYVMPALKTTHCVIAR